MGVAVSFFPAGSIATLEALESDFGGAGFAALERRQVNGLWALGFTRPEEDCRGEAFFHPAYPDYVLTVYVTPLGEDGSTAAAMGRAILDSLSPAPME